MHRPGRARRARTRRGRSRSPARRTVHGAVSAPAASTAPTPWAVTLQSVLQRFLQSSAEPLTAGELSHLDALGNQNGGYDVGDLRKWLREQETKRKAGQMPA